MVNPSKQSHWSTAKVIALCALVACLAFYAASKSSLLTRPKSPEMAKAIAPVSNLNLPLETQPQKERGEFTFVRVTDVFEGDVIRLADGTEVNLIGVTCPKSDETDPSRLAVAREAFAFTSGAVLGREVRLEYESAHPLDGSGRTLAYVYLRDGSLVNAELIKQGYGNAFTRYAYQFSDDFRKYELAAKNNKIGLWEDRQPTETTSDSESASSTDSSITTNPTTISSETSSAATRPRATETIPQRSEVDRDYQSNYPQSQTYVPPVRQSYTPPSYVPPRIELPERPRVGENGSYYGEISERTGRPKTVYVQSYTRRDGTYVRSHFRSSPRR